MQDILEIRKDVNRLVGIVLFIH